ncbi:MAG TPA: YceI family protein [Candidatus Acidoferrales bacterium]|jgi:polyisoprenoid-binding protein YceI|nr:YceI family protein [Candidatus Acidoferrales bacterium]
MNTAAQKGLALMDFQIDKTVSRFQVQAFATGLLSSFGHNPRIAIRDYEAEIQCVPDTFEKAYLKLTVQMSRMEVVDEMKKSDQAKLEQEMYEKVLDVSHYPTAVYESKEIIVQKVADGRLNAGVNGELSFHGMTQPLTLQANVNVLGTLLRIGGDFTLRQSDYGIKPVSFAAGALRLKDELKFTFDLVARKQD